MARPVASVSSGTDHSSHGWLLNHMSSKISCVMTGEDLKFLLECNVIKIHIHLLEIHFWFLIWIPEIY
jgi:hypothetical protein